MCSPCQKKTVADFIIAIDCSSSMETSIRAVASGMQVPPPPPPPPPPASFPVARVARHRKKPNTASSSSSSPPAAAAGRRRRRTTRRNAHRVKAVEHLFALHRSEQERNRHESDSEHRSRLRGRSVCGPKTSKKTIRTAVGPLIQSSSACVSVRARVRAAAAAAGRSQLGQSSFFAAPAARRPT